MGGKKNKKNPISDWEQKICKMDLKQLHIPENKGTFRASRVTSKVSRSQLEEDPIGQRKRIFGASGMKTVIDGNISKPVRIQLPPVS